MCAKTIVCQHNDIDSNRIIALKPKKIYTKILCEKPFMKFDKLY